MAVPVSAGYQARIDTANTGLAGLPGIFNPQRRSVAYDAAAGLNEQGFTRDTMPQAIDEGGNIVYRLVRGQDGRLYSQAFRKVGQQHNARGTFFSSFAQRDQRDARQQLDSQQNAIMRQFGAAQQGLTDQQAAQDRSLRGDLASTRGEYADWQAAQQVPDPGAGVAPAGAAAMAAAARGVTAAGPSASNLPGTPGGIPNFARSPFLASAYPKAKPTIQFWGRGPVVRR